MMAIKHNRRNISGGGSSIISISAAADNKYIHNTLAYYSGNFTTNSRFSE